MLSCYDTWNIIRILYYVLDDRSMYRLWMCVSILHLPHCMKCRVIGLPITITSQWARWRLKSPASRLITQPLDQRKHQSSASLAFVRGIHHKGPVTPKMFPFDDVVMPPLNETGLYKTFHYNSCIWPVSWQLCCRGACWISGRCNTAASRFREIIR